MMFNKRRYSFLLIVLLCFSTDALFAQTWSEWFSQKKTQKKYLLEQLASLKLYAGYVKKGYELCSSGINFIKDASKGEFDLHDAFFSGLKSVSPAIKNSSKVAEILDMQIRISTAFSTIDKLGSEGNHQQYVRQVRDNLMKDCLKDLDALLIVITSDKLEMNDQDRLTSIDQLHTSMCLKNGFTIRFCTAVQSLSENRTVELNQLKEMEAIYEK